HPHRPGPGLADGGRAAVPAARAVGRRALRRDTRDVRRGGRRDAVARVPRRRVGPHDRRNTGADAAGLATAAAQLDPAPGVRLPGPRELSGSHFSRVSRYTPAARGHDEGMADIPRRAITRGAKLATLPLGIAGRATWGIGKRIGGRPAELVATEL